jgi:IS30 family transposase
METDIAVYFCDPQSPWQRGSNNNTNRLLRQYSPCGIDLAPYSQAQLNKIARPPSGHPDWPFLNWCFLGGLAVANLPVIV